MAIFRRSATGASQDDDRSATIRWSATEAMRLTAKPVKTCDSEPPPRSRAAAVRALARADGTTIDRVVLEP